MVVVAISITLINEKYAKESIELEAERLLKKLAEDYPDTFGKSYKKEDALPLKTYPCLKTYSQEEEKQINFDLEKIEFFVKELYKDPPEEFLWYPEDWPKVTNNGKTCNMLVGLCACAELHEITRWWKIFDIEKEIADALIRVNIEKFPMDKYIVDGKIVTGQELANNVIKTSMGGYCSYTSTTNKEMSEALKFLKEAKFESDTTTKE